MPLLANFIVLNLNYNIPYIGSNTQRLSIRYFCLLCGLNHSGYFVQLSARLESYDSVAEFYFTKKEGKKLDSSFVFHTTSKFIFSNHLGKTENIILKNIY